MTGKVPPAGSWYRIPLRFRVAVLPSDCACCGSWEPPVEPVECRDLAKTRPRLCEVCEGHVGELARVTRNLLLCGVLLGSGAALASRSRFGEGGAALCGLAASLVPVMAQPWAFPLVPLGREHGARAAPWVWRRSGPGGGELVTASGRLAAWLSTRNSLVPAPVPGAGTEISRGLRVLSGTGGWVTVALAYWQLALVLVGRRWGG